MNKLLFYLNGVKKKPLMVEKISFLTWKKYKKVWINLKEKNAIFASEIAILEVIIANKELQLFILENAFVIRENQETKIYISTLQSLDLNSQISSYNKISINRVKYMYRFFESKEKIGLNIHDVFQKAEVEKEYIRNKLLDYVIFDKYRKIFRNQGKWKELRGKL